MPFGGYASAAWGDVAHRIVERDSAGAALGGVARRIIERDYALPPARQIRLMPFGRSAAAAWCCTPQY